ncbi:hypothetical protein D3C71_1327220 [compost metagenome]
MTLCLVQLRAIGKQPRTGIAITVAGEVGNFLQQYLTVDARAVDLHAHLSDIRCAGDGGGGRRGYPFAQGMYQKPPDRYVGGAFADSIEGGPPGGFRRLGHTNTAALARHIIERH